MLTEKSAHRKDITTGKAELQHRHFATIATILRGSGHAVSDLTHNHEAVQNRLAEYFADELCSTNPRFNRARFLRACRND